MPVTTVSPLSLSARERFDVVVIGAGIAGVSAASALAQQGHTVALIDTRAEFPPAFRAEKIGDVQVDLFTQFGLGAVARSAMTAFDGVWVHRFGRIVEKIEKREYAFRYGDLVNALRGGLPENVRFIIGNVTELETSAERQVVSFRDGPQIEARLLILATGLGDVLAKKLGITRTMRSNAHSLALGFDLKRPPGDFPFASLVWQSDRPADKMAYLTIFPLEQGMRANLFLYHGIGDAWTKRFQADPGAAVHELIPTLEASFGRIESAGTVQARPIDLTTVTGHRQAGVLLIGDAFFTTCPSTGTGMHKALSDVERIAHHLPQWLATPGGLTAETLGQFYNDPLKQTFDARSMRISLLERSVRLEHGVYWTLRRARRQLVRRTQYAVRDLMAPARAAAAQRQHG